MNALVTLVLGHAEFALEIHLLLVVVNAGEPLEEQREIAFEHGVGIGSGGAECEEQRGAECGGKGRSSGHMSGLRSIIRA